MMQANVQKNNESPYGLALPQAGRDDNEAQPDSFASDYYQLVS